MKSFVYNFEKVHGRSMDTRRFVNWVLSGGVHPTKRGRDETSDKVDVGGQDKRIDIEDPMEDMSDGSPPYAPSSPSYSPDFAAPNGDKHNLRRLLNMSPTALRFPIVRQRIAINLLRPVKQQYRVALSMLDPECVQKYNLTPSNVTCETLKECRVMCDKNGNVTQMYSVYRIPANVHILRKLCILRMNIDTPFQELPSSFYKLTNLEDCTLTSINGSISPEIAKMTKLDMFEITNGNVTSLPDSLWTMQSLRIVMIVNRNETQMTRPIPETIEMPKLSHLILSHCGLPGGIPRALGDQPQLEFLNLRNNQLEGDVTWLRDTDIGVYDVQGNPNLTGPLNQ